MRGMMFIISYAGQEIGPFQAGDLPGVGDTIDADYDENRRRIHYTGSTLPG
jgi:hypothetical protein